MREGQTNAPLITMKLVTTGTCSFWMFFCFPVQYVERLRGKYSVIDCASSEGSRGQPFFESDTEKAKSFASHLRVWDTKHLSYFAEEKGKYLQHVAKSH